MRQFLLFCFYVGCMLGMTYLFASGALGSFRLGWRYMGTLIRHVAALAVLGVIVAAIVTGLQ